MPPAGVLGLSPGGGFWLSHSVPKYPDSPADSNFTGIQLGQTWHGQSFVCVSLRPSALEALADTITLEHHPLIGRAKDLASAAVLLSLIFAGAVWLSFLYSRLLS